MAELCGCIPQPINRKNIRVIWGVDERTSITPGKGKEMFVFLSFGRDLCLGAGDVDMIFEGVPSEGHTTQA